MSDTRFEVKSGFYDSQNQDRLYSADDMNQPYKSFLTEGIVESSTGLQVTSPSLTTVKVAAGNAILLGKWVNVEDTTITVPSNTGMYSRIDAVFLQVDTNIETRAAAIIYRTGEPAAEPIAPDHLHDAGIKEVRLANVNVNASGQATAVTDTRGNYDCPYITIRIGDSQIKAAAEDVLEDHPEWTTTVQDGSITAEKLASSIFDHTLSVAGKVADAKDVGDELTNLKSDLSQIMVYFDAEGYLCFQSLAE